MGIIFPKHTLEFISDCPKTWNVSHNGYWYGFEAFLIESSTNKTMLRWILIFLVIALIAAVLGFGGIAAGAASIAQIIFYIFLVLLVISVIMHLVRKV